MKYMVVLKISIMFNKKKIHEIDTKLNDIVDQVSELKSEYDQILEKLDNENFTADWDEYLKWREMKDQIPDIEEMYRLKELKRLISVRDKHENLKNTSLASYYMGSISRNRSAILAACEMFKYYTVLVIETENKIREYIDRIRKQKNKKELIGFFKLYGINTSWIKP